MARKIVYIMLFLLYHIDAHAYRPFTTEDAGVGETGEHKIEIGFLSNKQNKYWYNYISFLYGIGLGKAEMIVETPYCIDNQSRGLEGIVLAAKINVLGVNEEAGILTTKVCYEFPDDYFGVSAIATKKYNRLAIHSQIGLELHFKDNVTLFGLGFDYTLLPHFSIILDNFVECNYDIMYYKITSGIIYNINTTTTLDIATGCCYAKNNYREFFSLAGISMVF